jgi:hypothetical protein
VIGHIHIRMLISTLMFAPVPPPSPNPPLPPPHTHPRCRADLTHHVWFDPTVPNQRVTLSYRSCTDQLCPEHCPNTHPLTTYVLVPRPDPVSTCQEAKTSAGLKAKSVLTWELSQSTHRWAPHRGREVTIT